MVTVVLSNTGASSHLGIANLLSSDNSPIRICRLQWPLDGTPPSPPKKGQNALADFVTYNDAITKMRYAATNREETGQPFFLVTGIKRPHLNWRAPAGYVDMYATPARSSLPSI